MADSWRASRTRTANLFKTVIKRVLKKPEKLTVSQWAERFRILDESSNFSGKWSNDITPYMIGVMDAFNDPYIQEINFVKSTQVGGTEAMLNMLGWVIMNDPAPTMIVYPTDDLAKDTSSDRLKPSLRKTPEIEERFFERASKELRLKFQGMTIYLRGGGSPSKLASKAIKYLFFDEIDKMDGASKKEASPYNLAKERTRTYPYGRKIYTCSTPTLKTNYVWDLHEKADAQLEYFVKCPHCGEEITFRFANLHFDKPAEGEEMTIEERARTAVYVCQECGCEITDADKLRMLRKGVWRDTKKTCKGRPRKVSFWINSLYSRFLTWEDIAKEFLTSKDDPEKLQNFVNSWLAEPWEDTNLKTTSDTVADRQTELPEFVVPEWAKLLTAGVDVQETTLYWTIRAWGSHLTSQNIAHGQAMGFPDIERIMNLPYYRENGEQVMISLCLIDSGFDADSTYEFCATNSDWSLPVKGASNPMMSNFKLSKVNSVKANAFGLNLVLVDSGKYKDTIAARMRKQNGRGAWMVYNGCDEEYAQQVTAEHKINRRMNNGAVRQVWTLKHSHGDNHYLDCEVYAFAAADIMGVRTLHLQEASEEAQQAIQQKPEQMPEEQHRPEEQWIQTNENWV